MNHSEESRYKSHFRSNIKLKVSNIYLTEKWRKVDSEEWEVFWLNPYMNQILCDMLKYFWFYTFIRLVNNHVCRAHPLGLLQFVYQSLNLEIKNSIPSIVSMSPLLQLFTLFTCSSNTPYFLTKSAVSAANARASAETELNGISSFCCFRRADNSLFDRRWTL